MKMGALDQPWLTASANSHEIKTRKTPPPITAEKKKLMIETWNATRIVQDVSKAARLPRERVTELLDEWKIRPKQQPRGRSVVNL